MYSNDNISNIIYLLKNSKFDEKLINEISNCAMLLCNFYDSDRTIRDERYKILLNDMILSFLSMQNKYENIVYTNPFNIFEFSWIYKLNKNKHTESEKEMEFNNSVLAIVKSNFILPNEFPIEMKAAVLANIYSKEYLRKNYNAWYNFVNNKTENILDRYLYLTSDILKSLFVYNSEFINYSKKELFKSIGVYLYLRRDYSTLIILASKIKDDFLAKLVMEIDDAKLSLSDQFGKGLIWQSQINE